MFDFISRFFPTGTSVPKNINLKNTYLKYGITTTIKMVIKGAFGEMLGTRKNAFLGNSASLMALYTGRTFSEIGIFDGFASSLIGDDGTPDLSVVDEIMTKSHYFKNTVLQDKDIVMGSIYNTNVVSVIYNMLRLYYIKLYGNIECNPDADYYSNGHVKVTNQQAFGEFNTVRIDESVDFDEGNVTPEMTHSDIARSKHSIYYDMGSNIPGSTFKILKIAHAGWQSKAPIAICHSSERLAEKYVLFNGYVKGKLPEWSTITAEQIHATIGEFVRRHAAYRDFEHAYAMVISVLTRPVPRSVEAIVWNTNEVVVQMPLPVCLRALAPELYSGQIYTRSPEWQDDFHSWFSSPTAAVAHSVAMLEAVYTEAFHLTRLKKHSDIDRENFMAMTTGISDCPNVGIMLDTALACLRYGREYEFSYRTMAGVDRLSTIPNLNAQMPNVTVVDADAHLTYDLGELTGTTAPINIFAYAPVVYPSLSYGINEDGYYMNGDKVTVDIHASDVDDNMVFNNPEEFSKFMSTMRLFGYDVKAKRSYKEKSIYNWSDNASGRYIYVHDPKDKAPSFSITNDDIKRRANSWIQLPTLYGDFTVSYELGEKSITWFSGDQRIAFGMGTAQSISRSEYVKALSKLSTSRPTVKIVPLHRRSDFHESQLTMPASRPTLTGTSGVTQTGDTTQPGLEHEEHAPEALPPQPGPS
jgi:hypothetical protein